MQVMTPKAVCTHLTSNFLYQKCEHVPLLIRFFFFLFFRTITAKAKLLGVEWGTEMGGGSAQGEMLPLRDMDQGHPGEGWEKMHRK